MSAEDQAPRPDAIAAEIERRKAAAADLVKYLPLIRSALESGDFDAAQMHAITLTEAVMKVKNPRRRPPDPEPPRKPFRHSERDAAAILRNILGETE